MVKIGEYDDGEDPSDSKAVLGTFVPRAKPFDGNFSSGLLIPKEEGGPSSSCFNLRSQFIGMGFSSALVENVLLENGQDDDNVILEALHKYSTSEEQVRESSSSIGGLFSSDSDKEIQLPSRSSLSECYLNVKPSVITAENRSCLLGMNFSMQEVDSALHKLGKEASIEELVDCIVTAKASEETQTNFSESSAMEMYSVAGKTICLLRMGFTESEVNSAVCNVGLEVPVELLAEWIVTHRTVGGTSGRHSAVNSEEHISSSRSNVKSAARVPTVLTSGASFHYVNKNSAGTSQHGRRSKYIPIEKTCHVNPVHVSPRACTSSSVNNESCRPQALPDLPYFIYGSLSELSEGAWKQYSQFLYDIKPEFVNSEIFSSLKRKESYLHNLPAKTRHRIQPTAPMSIKGVIPATQKGWPSWDPRKKLDSTIEADMTEIPRICERLERRVRDSHGVPSLHDQNFILQQCKQLNLIWVGKNKLSPLEPDQLERVLGYPINHTHLQDLDLFQRLKIMKLCFQTDTIGYILSPLKDLYPDGLRVLSLNTGIGGAEVALNRLGMHLKCVVSIETSEVNQKIFKRFTREKHHELTDYN
ncbi:DNA (Cytosine-5)-methyltransferase DRM2 [Rhynchospora pubera]|uniref:DNA (Cytosine-5)-methyltransferase DRM2 n=1 Tax=Rhynchospora pubera TaxID=906938 RepID=A0AAV8GX99_9POAL|nr:DNA (Cytosine-5)-methyltransferase DRM2 [Rhynchospora pubera]